ncbi:MAG TPA: DUF3054 domain-containing protein [Thermobifida alba]|nr:DUF3054 domain-containing protein [Thermobifida alba]
MRSLPAAVVDAAVVLLFVLIGRSSHGEANTLLDVVVTLWPFAASLTLGWLVTRAWRLPIAPLRTGLGVWAITVAAGMALRALSGGGIAVSFIAVASLFLAAGLIGWRAVATLLLSRRATAPSPR